MRNKRILTLIFVVAFLTLLVGCFPQPTNLPPKITSYPVTTVTVGGDYIYDVGATDPNTGDILTYSLTTEPPGMLINADNGVITWEAEDITAAGVGDYDVVVKVSDGGGLSDTQSFTIKVSKPSVPPVNQKPVIYSIPITTATVGETYFYNVYATDLDNDVLTYSLTTKPTGMTISSASGLIMWTPTAEGVYTVVVKVSDGALSDTQGFTITVSKPWAPPPVNHAPIITSSPEDTAIVGEEYIYEVKATDPDGDTLTYSLITKPGGMLINSTTGLISWTPTEMQVGVGNFTVKVSDGKLCDTQTFGIIVRELELGLIGIEVDPKTMTLFVGESEPIKSVTATYEFRGYEVDIDLTECLFMSSDLDVATVSNVGEIETIGEGTADILVSYKGEFDTLEVTVIDLVQNTNTGKYYHTIQAAIDDGPTLDGHTIEVSAGTYNEQVVISKQLTLNGTNASESIIDGDDTTAVTISANDVIVDGFTLDGGITLDDQANPINGGTISNNIITGADSSVEPIKAQNGIRVGFDLGGEGVDGVTIEDNIIINNNKAGIEFSNAKEEIDYGGDGIQRISNITISGNEIKDNGASGISTYGPGPNTLINNIISNNAGAGMNLKFSSGDIVTGNTITNNTSPGITLKNATDAIVENNSISGHQGTETEWKGSGIHIFGSSENTIRYNDISGNNYGIFIRKKDDDLLSGNSINFNNIYGNNTYGILNALVDPPDSVDAKNNWWGIEGTGENAGSPDEAGNNNVSANVDYEPWSTSKFN